MRLKKITWTFFGVIFFMAVVKYIFGRESSMKQLAKEKDAAFEKQLSNETKSIPKILHQVMAAEMVYGNYKSMIASCLKHNPDWKYYLWRDKDAEALIADRFPSLAARFKEFGTALHRSDAIRYIVLYFFGGIYLDMDVECVRPFFPALANVSAFLDREREEHANILWNQPYCAMNSAMGGYPGHPFYRDVIEALMRTDPKTHAIFSTGPQLLTKVYNRHYMSSEATLPPMLLLHHKIMSPLLDGQQLWKVHCNGTENAHTKPVASRSWKERGCIMLRSKNWRLDDSDNSTLAIHRFLHLGHEFAARHREKPFNITQQFGSRVNYYLQERPSTIKTVQDPAGKSP